MGTTMQEAQSSQQAKQGLVTFFIILIIFLILGYWLKTTQGNSFVYFYAPGIASIITRLIRREGFKDVSFSFRGHNPKRTYLIALFFPVVVGFVAYGLTWVTELTEFDRSLSIAQQASPLPLPENPYLGFSYLLLLAWIIATLVFIVNNALAEEIGWRGYMLTRLIDSGIRYPILIHGIIWAAYHYPLILGGKYSASGTGIFALAMFTIVATTFSYLLAWLRLDNGTIWPAVILHAVWNGVMQVGFDLVTLGENSALWVGESGIVLAVVLILFVLLLKKRYFQFSKA